MKLKFFANALAALNAAFITYVGLTFLIDPLTTVTGFGLPQAYWPGGEAAAILNVKGDRDLVMGLVMAALLLARQHRALGWALLAMAVAPIMDAVIVLSYGGSVAAAVGIHLTAAVTVVLAGVLQLRVAARGDRAAAGTRPPAAVTGGPAPGAVPAAEVRPATDS